jgi:hypothetical protein
MSIHSGLLSKVRIEPTAPIIRTKQAAREVNGQNVEILVMAYTHRITINVTTEGKLGQLVSLFSFVPANENRSQYLSPTPFLLPNYKTKTKAAMPLKILPPI